MVGEGTIAGASRPSRSYAILWRWRRILVALPIVLLVTAMALAWFAPHNQCACKAELSASRAARVSRVGDVSAPC
ncbi:MAG: hypothetical protein ACREQI_13245 [Candidatus Binataceae bacterium]